MRSASRTSAGKGDRKEAWLLDLQEVCLPLHTARAFLGWLAAKRVGVLLGRGKKFWQDIGACEKKEDQDKLVMEKMTKVVEESRCAGAGGQSLPLSVYATQGFDTSRIEQFCDDKKPSKMFGTVYRVDIEYQNKKRQRHGLEKQS